MIFATFLLLGGMPWGNHAKRCINEKTTRCLYVPVYNYNRFLNIGGIGNTRRVMSVIAKFLAGSKSVRHVSHSYAYGCIRTYGRKTHCAYECDGIQIQKKENRKRCVQVCRMESQIDRRSDRHVVTV